MVISFLKTCLISQSIFIEGTSSATSSPAPNRRSMTSQRNNDAEATRFLTTRRQISEDPNSSSNNDEVNYF